jgi:uncharacterized protein (DUF736 family)
MAGRKPDYRVVIPQDNGRGKTNYFKVGAAWRNSNKETGDESIGLQINVGVPILLQPDSKLVLFENKDEEDSSFEAQS